jgi:Icc-related predicted phosphoesterase
MKILAISDIHGNEQALEGLKEIVEQEDPDLIVFSGDIVKAKARGSEWYSARRENRDPEWNKGIRDEEKEDVAFYELFFSRINDLGLPVLCVPGNMDAPKERYGAIVNDAMDRFENIHVIHNSEFRYNGFVFRGFGGEITEDQREDMFVHQYNRLDIQRSVMDEGKNIILVTHSPPVGERVSKEGASEKGSAVVNDVVERTRALMVFCGHAHEPNMERISGASVINPGPLKGNSYAIVEVDDNEHIDVKHKKMA